MLTPPQLDLLHRCLRAAVEGDYFPDWELPTLMGARVEELRAILRDWAHLDLCSRDTREVLINVVVNLCGYPHNQKERLWKEVRADESTLDELVEELEAHV